MTTPLPSADVLRAIIYLVALCALSPLLGYFMFQVYRDDDHHRFLRPFRFLENWIYKIADVNPREEMTWKNYAWALLTFNFVGFAIVLILQLIQQWLPFNPQHLPNVPFPLAFNTAISFMSNTNWQAYSGESTLSYFTQLAGLTVQNFLSAATAMAVMVALARALTRKLQPTIGNFWSDLIRSTVYILLPLSIVFAIFLVGQGVVQSFSHYIEATTIEGAKQLIPFGPAASQIAIKQLGTNGGGFFGVNSAHPFENPTALSNFWEMLAILLIPSALVFTFGFLIKNKRHGAALWVTMLIMFVVGLVFAYMANFATNPAIGNHSFLEGIETRFGIGNSSIWSVATSAASNGSVNAMHDSLSPLGGLIPMFNIMLGEVIFGGVGCGLYGIVLFAILTVFLAGLMVGRTPEYLGKKISAKEVIWASVGILVPCALILVFSSIAAVTEMGLSSLNNKGPHGLSEILYVFSSASGNNGSAFAGLNANTNFYNYATGFCMLIARFAVLIPVLAIAGSLAEKKTTPPSAGTFPTHGALFVFLLISVIIIVGALTFFPALTLGPIVEHLLMLQGKAF
ncbi:MAG: potassium-transporting ATPase subunit KdpA [Deltaproteobacteria bacterium]|nr:potassium-transporting ATPase subunit KdpA [Deltaproteobacteria bacterium]